MRICVNCNIEKEDSFFYKRRDGKFRGRFCKDCENERCKKRYYEKNDEIRSKSAEYRAKNKEKIRVGAKIQREKSNHSRYSNVKAKEYRGKMSNSYIRARIRNVGVSNDDINEDALDKMKVFVAIERVKKVIEGIGIKICDHCNEKKETSFFYKRQWTWKGVKKYGIDNVCKQCSKKRNKTYKHERHSKP